MISYDLNLSSLKLRCPEEELLRLDTNALSQQWPHASCSKFVDVLFIEGMSSMLHILLKVSCGNGTQASELPASSLALKVRLLSRITPCTDVLS